MNINPTHDVFHYGFSIKSMVQYIPNFFVLWCHECRIMQLICFLVLNTRVDKDWQRDIHPDSTAYSFFFFRGSVGKTCYVLYLRPLTNLILNLHTKSKHVAVHKNKYLIFTGQTLRISGIGQNMKLGVLVIIVASIFWT